MPVSSQPRGGHRMSAEVRGSGGIPPTLIKIDSNGCLVFCDGARTTFLWTAIELFFCLLF